ncbi:MAG: UDPGP type 1 family protein [Planctomycetota bacterium]
MSVTTKTELESRLAEHGQSHLLRFWDELCESSQQKLADQIAQIDFKLIEDLRLKSAEPQLWTELAARANVPTAITLEDFADPKTVDAAVATGKSALKAGELAMVLVAGGQGSRLGFHHPKGMYPVGPVSNASLYQIHFEKVLARARQFGAPIPMYVMTSPPTHDETTTFLQQHQFFGMDPDHVKIFCQGTMPAIDEAGQLLLASKDEVFLSPNGHGGTLAALVDHGCLEHARSLGVKHLFYGQVDNPLIQICDPALIGFHINSGSEMTSQVVRKIHALQKVGNVVEVDGQVQIIEYSDLPEQSAKQVDDQGNLKLWAGSIAVHIFDLGFLETSSSEAETLPFHRAFKKVPFIDSAGELISPDGPNATKFERFIFDLLPFAKNAIVCEVAATDGFCALKNAPGAAAETEAHVRQAISDLHRRWIEQAGGHVAENINVEISPLCAVDSEMVSQQLGKVVVNEDKYFESPS